jgi:hypothetical protein
LVSAIASTSAKIEITLLAALAMIAMAGVCQRADGHGR